MGVKKGLRHSRPYHKGQVALYLIIGLLIIVVIGVGVILSGDEESVLPFVSIAEKGKVQTHVENCLKEIGKDGIKRVGLQGGFVNLSRAAVESSQAYPFDSDFLVLNDGRFVLPYWFYQKEDGTERSIVPPLERSYEGDQSVEQQLIDHINVKLQSCLDDFSSLQAQGITVAALDDPEPSIVFRDEDVLIELDYNLRIFHPDDSEETIDGYEATIPVALKRIYLDAYSIVEHESQTVFLEQITQHLINIYSRVDSNYLPPMAGELQFTECYDQEFWIVNDVERNVKDMLAANIGFIRVNGSKENPITIGSDIVANEERREQYQGTMDSFRVHPPGFNSPDTQVWFDYKTTYPMHLDLGTQGLLTPQSMEINLLFAQWCMFDYQFLYDLKFPVLVTMINEDSLIDGEPYLFQFPMMAVLKNNYPRISISDLYGVRPTDTPTYECSQKQRQSSNITLTVTDREGTPISDVPVYFQCGPRFVYDFDENGTVVNATPFAKKCSVGITDASGTFEDRFPPCSHGGVVVLEKPGWVTKRDVVGTVSRGEGFEKSYTLEKVREFEVKVRKYHVNPVDMDGNPDIVPGIVLNNNGGVEECYVRGRAQNLKDYEQVIVRLRNLDNPDELNTDPLFILEGKGTETIRLAPGNYTADLMLLRSELYDGEMTIKKNSQVRETDGGLFAGNKRIKYPKDDVLLPEIFTGGSYYNFTVTYDDIKFADTMTLYVFDEGKPEIVENIGAPVGHRFECSKLNPRQVKPVFGRSVS